MEPGTVINTVVACVKLLRPATMPVGPFGSDMPGWWVVGSFIGVSTDEPMWISTRALQASIDDK